MLSRHFPNSPPDNVLITFQFTGAAASNIQFQLFYQGQLMNEGDDYSIIIGGGFTSITFATIVPQIGEDVIAFF